MCILSVCHVSVKFTLNVFTFCFGATFHYYFLLIIAPSIDKIMLNWNKYNKYSDIKMKYSLYIIIALFIKKQSNCQTKRRIISNGRKIKLHNKCIIWSTKLFDINLLAIRNSNYFFRDTSIIDRNVFTFIQSHGRLWLSTFTSTYCSISWPSQRSIVMKSIYLGKNEFVTAN